MIHFNFTVSDAEAEDIFNILNNQIHRNREEMLELMVKGDEYNMRGAYERDNEYIRGLIGKMSNTKVEEPKGWVCNKCGTDRTKSVCPYGHTAALTGECPMVGVAQ